MKIDADLHESVASCPECNGQEWFLILSGFGVDFEAIKSFQCANCGFEIVLRVYPEKHMSDNTTDKGFDSRNGA